MQNISVIAFDADDTLWVNEPYFQETERTFCALLTNFLPEKEVSAELFKTEMKNLSLYGYGAKGFMLSMVETALRISCNRIDPAILSQIIELGQALLDIPIELLESVEDVLKTLSGKYRLILATKGDLLDQERKLRKSGIEPYFHHIEIMSEKREEDYQKLLAHLGCQPENFLMIGNSLKSDILPVLQLGGYGIHIPFHTTWAHEISEEDVQHPKFRRVSSLREILAFLER